MKMSLLDTALVFLSAHWFSISITVCILAIVYIFGVAPFRRSAIVAAVGDLPGPPPLPFVGNFLDFLRCKGQFHTLFDDYYKKYGGLFALMLFGKKPSLAISDPEMLKELFVKEFQNFRDRPSILKLPKPFDSMLTTAVGDTWHRIRTTLSPTFSAHKMKLMIPLMNKSCDLLEKKLDQVAGTGETIDIYKYHQGLTMEAILATFFGIESNAQNDYNDPAFMVARQTFKRGTFQRIFIFLLLLIPGGVYVMKLFPSIAIGQFMGIASLANNIIEAKKKSGHTYTKDFLDLMLTNTTNESLPEDKRLTEDEVVAQSIVFLFAGYETTSNTLAMVCHYLITNPDVQEKLQKEIDETWSEDDQPPSYEVVQSLPYLDMVISETLRLCPPAVALSRNCNEDCVIKGLPIKKGTTVLALTYSIHRDPRYYPDPEKFDPERFSAEAKASRDPYTYLPFGHGPRNCIGMRFAQMEMKLALVRILKRFTLVVAPETKIPPVLKISSVLGCAEGIQLRVERRS